MKTYSECKIEIARQYGYLTWSGFMEGESLMNCDSTDKHKRYAIMNEEVAKLYAQQVSEDIRQRCYDNSKAIDKDGYEAEVIKWTILSTEIILP